MEKPNKASDLPPKNIPEKDIPGEKREDMPSTEPRRYDEADPRWRNPDVQMRNPEVNQPKGPRG